MAQTDFDPEVTLGASESQKGDSLSEDRKEVHKKCEKIFSENKCQEKINNDLQEKRWKYLDCNDEHTYKEISLQCLKGAVISAAGTAVGEVVGIGATPVFFGFYLKAAMNFDEACSSQREKKEEIAAIVKPLWSTTTYETLLKSMSCSQLGHMVEQKVQSASSTIAEKKSLQKRYDEYLGVEADESRRQRAERLYPKTRREFTDGEKEFIKLLNEREKARPKWDWALAKKTYQDLLKTYQCASSAHIAELLCGAGGAFAPKAAVALKNKLFSSTVTKSIAAEATTPSLSVLSQEAMPKFSKLNTRKSEAYIVTFKNKEKAVFKVCGDLIWESDCHAEVAAHVLDKMTGFNLVPETIAKNMTINGKIQKGSLQKFIEGTSGQKAKEAMVSQEDLNKQRVFDFLIQNSDREKHNYLVQSNGRIVSIDHADAFRNDYSVSLKGATDFAKSQEGSAVLQRLKKITKKDLEDQLGLYLDGDQRASLYQRIQQLLATTQ